MPVVRVHNLDATSVWQEVQRQRDRYMQDPIPVRLGILASTLARAASCAADPHRHA